MKIVARRTARENRKSGRLILLTLLFTQIAGPCRVLPMGSAALEHEEFKAALEAVMPLEAKENGVVQGRMYQDLYTDYPEFWFELRSDFATLPVTAEVRAPDGPSIFRQLTALRERSPEAEITDLAQKIQLKRWRLPPEHCPELAGTPWDLPTALDFQRQAIVLHPMILEIGFLLGHVEGRLHLTDEQAPAVWAQRVRESVEACVIRSDPGAFFQTRTTWGLTAERTQQLDRMIKGHLPETETYAIYETLRTDFDEDGLTDVLFLYRRYADLRGDRPAQVFLGLLRGNATSVEPVVVGDVQTNATFLFMDQRTLRLSIEQFEEWPPTPAGPQTTERTATVLLQDGSLKLNPSNP